MRGQTIVLKKVHRHVNARRLLCFIKHTNAQAQPYKIFCSDMLIITISMSCYLKKETNFLPIVGSKHQLFTTLNGIELVFSHIFFVYIIVGHIHKLQARDCSYSILIGLVESIFY
jgi:hypothetical protein